MSYPPPSDSPHPSLPARPPPPAPIPQNDPRRPSSFGTWGGFAPRQVAGPPALPAQSPTAFQRPQQASFGPSYTPQNAGYNAVPQIRNPFAVPTQTAYSPEDPDMMAQIAQWQSAYAAPAGSAPRRNPSAAEPATSANAAPLGGGRETAAAAARDTGVAAIVADAKTNKKTVVRTGGGTKWTDDTLLEWDPAHFRLFVGNLAGEVTDESLHKAFSRWPSLQKARVIRDKRNAKSKGYGFVSFSDGDEYFRAARDMQGKYIGSHPVLLRRSTTEIRPVAPTDKRGKGKYGKGKGNNRGSGNANTGGGVLKKSNKTKGGLRVLG